jgi:hypothetical protein
MLHSRVVALRTGQRLGPYEILAPLGSGGMGEVYRARDTRLDREVAIKVLPSNLSMPDAVERFEREARAVAALSHPNILSLHDVGSEDGLAFAVTELLEGETLRERLISGGPLPWRRALEHAAQIAHGLAAAHERGIVHRDLKPENIFLTSDGRVKILDFGLAVQDATASGAGDAVTRAVTNPGMLIGTTTYMAPEQVQGQPATTRTDLFALGGVVYEMLTGAHPFKRETPVHTLTAILHDEPAPLAGQIPELTPGAARLVERCLEKRPTDRPSSTRDLAFYFESLAAGETAAMPAFAERSGRLLRTLRTRAIVTLFAVLLLLWTASWAYVRVTADRLAAEALETELARAEHLVARVQAERLVRLQLTARLVASFPELNALFGQTDAATVRDYLLSYQQRNPGTPLLIALGAAGAVLARTDQPAIGRDAPEGWLAALAAAKGEPALVTIGDRTYHAAVAAAEAGGTRFGYVIAASPADAAFAGDLREMTQDEIVLLSASGVLATTLPGGNSPWSSIAEWRAGTEGPAAVVRVGEQRFAAREVPLAPDPPVSAIVLKSQDEALAPFRRIQRGLLTLGILTLVAAALVAVWLARTLNAPGRIRR